MKLKLVAAVSALAIPALAHAEQSGPPPAVPKPTKADAQKVVQIITSDKVAQNSAADADIDEDFSIISGLSGGPTSYLWHQKSALGAQTALSMWSGRAAHQGGGDERIHANEARICE
jgi:hypothetical protein